MGPRIISGAKNHVLLYPVRGASSYQVINKSRPRDQMFMKTGRHLFPQPSHELMSGDFDKASANDKGSRVRIVYHSFVSVSYCFDQALLRNSLCCAVFSKNGVRH